MDIRKVWVLWIVWSLSVLSVFGQDEQKSFRFNFRDRLFRIHDFNADLQKSRSGNYLMTITALNPSDEMDTRIEGAYSFILNTDTVNLNFIAGRATLELKDPDEKMLVQYLVYDESSDEKLLLHKQNKLFFLNLGDDPGTRHIPLWLSIIPPLLAIGFALLFKEVIISLVAGIWIGVFAIYGFKIQYFLSSIMQVVDTYIINALSDKGRLSVIIFSLLIGGMVAIISRNGGMAGIVQKLSKYANSARSSQLITWLLGLAIFFDDYANTLIVGNTMRPVTDRFRISREKLAYIVDSTAAPVAAIAFVTTWIGAELGYIGDQVDRIAEIDASAYSIFLQSLQFAYYPILTLIFVFIMIWLRRDFGSMFRAEIRARKEGKIYDERTDLGQVPVDSSMQSLDPVKGIKFRWQNAFFPILTVIVVTMIGLGITGWSAGGWSGSASFMTNLSTLIGAADSYIALLWASFTGVALAIVLSLTSKTLSVRYSVESMMDGFKTMLPAIIILVLAWSLADITGDLHTAIFLTSVFQGAVDPEWLPLITFVLAAAVSFSTGSSWSTMAILYPIMLPTTWTLAMAAGLEHEAAMGILYNVTAVVLAGSVFGDHCSPISDTTVLSSLASSCNHIDHVRTQLPYAIAVGLISILLGGVLTVAGSPWYLNFPIGILIIFLILRFAGKSVPEFHIEGSRDQNG